MHDPDDRFRRRAALRLMVFVSLISAWTAVFAAQTVTLPPVDELTRQAGTTPQRITVVEPHESTRDHLTPVDYLALPINPLLDRWFGEAWKAPDSELVFVAEDGYRSAIPGSRLQAKRALLAHARADGAPFAVDNPSQHEKGIRLGPYYLIWDNRADAELIERGAYGWPYQVVRVELRTSADDRALLPASPTAESRQALADVKEYCLSCHRINGQGGEKYPEDLLQATCRWNRGAFEEWIDDPARVRPGTRMPPLDRMLPAAKRSEVIDRLADYLWTLARESGRCASGR
ncbi:MAG: cytochrome c [Methylotetracoccus sp.]